MSKGVEEKIKEIHDYLQNQSKKSKPINLLEDNDGYEDGMLIPVYSPKKKKAVKFPLQSPDLSKFQLRSERNIANGYLGLGANKKINEVFIPELPISKITNLQSSLNGLQLKSEKNVANGYLGLDSNVKIGLGFIPELPISKITNLQSSLNRDILSIAITGDRNKILTLTKIDGTTLTAPFTDLGDTADVFLNGLNFNTANGTFTAVLNDSKTSSVNIDGRYSLLNHHHDDRYLKLDGGIVKGETTFNSPIFMNDTLEVRNELHIKQSISAMNTAPDTIGVNKGWIKKEMLKKLDVIGGEIKGSLKINTESKINELLILRAEDRFSDVILSDNGGSVRLRNDQGVFKLFSNGIANSDNAGNAVSILDVSTSSLTSFTTIKVKGDYPQYGFIDSKHNRSGILKTSLLTADRNWFLPNSSGELALSSSIPTKTSQLNNDSGFAYVGNIPNIHVVTLGGVLNSAALNVHYPSSKNPIKTILVNKNPGSEAMYIRISSSEWLKINATKI